MDEIENELLPGEVDDFGPAESVSEYLQGMADGDLLRLAESFEQMIALPAWAHLGELVRVYQRRVKAGAAGVVWSKALVGKPLPDTSALYTAAGRVRGMDELVGIVQTVLKLAEATEREIETGA